MTTLTKKMALESYRFIKAQTNAIDKSKYIESEKKCKDLFFDELGRPSQNFYLWWIQNHAEKFRQAWPVSLCKKCSKVISCKECLKEICSDFNEDLKAEKGIICYVFR